MFQIIKVKNHVNITLLGIKFNILLKTFQKDREYFQKKYQSYEKAEDIQPAQGTLRLVQMANLKLLKDFDKICKTNGLQYWADFGTLLGAVRHKGFIPWDDDIDVGMLRRDYNKIIEAFKISSRNPDIYADFYRDKTNPAQIIIKVQHKHCKYLFVDIFPFDIYGKAMSEQKQLEQTQYIVGIIANRKKESNFNMTVKEVTAKNQEVMQTKILTNELPDNVAETDIVWGIDFHHRWKNWFTNYNVIFPLKTMDFENYKAPCINKPDLYLKRLYGDYMLYPSKIGFGHSAYVNLSEDDKRVIEELKNLL